MVAIGLVPDEADRQLDIIADWGRYAEVLVYDDSDETFALESTGAG